MATYNPSDLLKPAHSQAFGNRDVYTGKCVIATDVANADVMNLAMVPAGTLVDRVVIKVPALDSSTVLTAKIGFAPSDGSAAPSDMASADVAVAASGAWAQAAATTTYEIFPPYKVTVDSYLQVVATHATTGSSGGGTVYGKVEGEGLGAK